MKKHLSSEPDLPGILGSYNAARLRRAGFRIGQPPEFLSRTQVAELCGVDQLSVRYWEKAGRLPVAKRTRQGWSLFAWQDLSRVLRMAIATGLVPALLAMKARGPKRGSKPGTVKAGGK
jgi:hypothetical protein